MLISIWPKLVGSPLRVRTSRSTSVERVRNDEREAARTKLKRKGRCSQAKESVVISVKSKFAT